ncbi:MAG: DUF4157 domain-containing protein [Myxococcaceae bacterium]|nr:DUF4157 domain-containing protein [Myxococcaceae bacterium]
MPATRAKARSAAAPVRAPSATHRQRRSDREHEDAGPALVAHHDFAQVPIQAGALLQRAAAPGHPSARGGARQGEAPPIVHEVLRSPGAPLDGETRSFMEPRFAHDFSRVRVHADARAAESARQVGALAYAVKEHVVFAEGQHSPGTGAGQALMAHELAHVVQQAGSAPSALSARLPISNEGERHADALAEAAMAGRQPEVSSSSVAGAVLARKEEPAAAAAALFRERLERIDTLLSYGVFDWAITDAEATEAFELLRAMSPQEQAQALKQIRLDRLIDNLPQQLQAELAGIVAKAGGEATVQTQVVGILTYTFFDWIGFISEAEAKRALGLLEALTVEERDRVIVRIPRQKRRRLHNALPAEGKKRFLQMWDEYNERELERQRQEMHEIVPGDRYLIRVTLVELNETLEAFSPRGVPFDVDDEGYAYYAPLDTFVRLVGLRRAEAEKRVQAELTSKSGQKLRVELKPRPPGEASDEFAPPPPRRTPAPEPAAKPPQEEKPDPQAEQEREFLLIFKSQAAQLSALGERARKDRKLWPEWEREAEALDRFFKWYEANKNTPKFLKTDLASLLGQMKADATIRQIKRDVEKKFEEEKEARKYSPEAVKARMAKYDEFFNLALRLRGESARRFPYVIPVPSEGVDILVTGDPVRQSVLNQIADKLMEWTREHFRDDNFTTIDPNGVLLHILKGGYDKALRAADKAPLEHEVIDRGEIVPGKALAAFGKTVATGLAAVAIVGVAVGLGILSGGAALVLLGGLAAYAGVSSYLERRKDIETKGYDVPAPVTAVQAAGDVVGVSQLIEGITGEKLGTGERLKSAERSEQFGAGTGSVAVLLTGSRAFRFGQGIGQRARVALPGSVPETLEGVPLKDLESQYPKSRTVEAPVRNPNPGPREAAARAALPEELRVGFDRWVEQMRANPKRKVDIEKVLEAKTQKQIENICKKPAEDYHNAVKQAKADAERIPDAKRRSAGDPLRPSLKKNEWKDGVSIHYEKTPPDAAEIQHAREIQARTGEEVHLFGDTPSYKTYPGIDGTIGTPPRALQLKNLADPAYLKVHAHDAFVKAGQHGYSKVEVHLRVKGSTLAEVKAAWEAKPAHPRGAEIGWETKLSMARSRLELSRLVIEASDGVWVVEAPPPSPGLPAVPVNVPGEKGEQGKPGKAGGK